MVNEYMKKLMPRHREILRRVALGQSYVTIAEELDMHPLTISLIMRSPLAQFELEKLQAVADEVVTNVPLRVEKAREIRDAGRLALQHNTDILSDVNVDVKVRANVARHFLDRAVFDVPVESSKDISFRDLLKSMSAIERQMMAKTVEGSYEVIENDRTPAQSSEQPDGGPTGTIQEDRDNHSNRED
jgi:hypothetical protein